MKKALILLVLAFTIVLTTSTAVDAKYMFRWSNHDVMRYTHSDLPRNIQPYVDYIDFDVSSVPMNGARLHFTSHGKNTFRLLPTMAGPTARFVRNAPEWSGDRSLASVQTEIVMHAIWPKRMVVDIEYRYADLQPFESAYKYI